MKKFFPDLPLHFDWEKRGQREVEDDEMGYLWVQTKRHLSQIPKMRWYENFYREKNRCTGLTGKGKVGFKIGPTKAVN